MVSDPAADMDPDSSYLRFSDPHPVAPAYASPFSPNSASASMMHLLERTDIGDHVALPFPQIEDRIADDLPGAVIRHVAAAIGVMKLDARRLQNFLARQQVFDVGRFGPL